MFFMLQQCCTLWSCELHRFLWTQLARYPSALPADVCGSPAIAHSGDADVIPPPGETIPVDYQKTTNLPKPQKKRKKEKTKKAPSAARRDEEREASAVSFIMVAQGTGEHSIQTALANPAEFWKETPPLTKALVVTVPLFFVLTLLYPPLFNVLALIPANTFLAHFWVWNLITSAFVETNFLGVLVTVLILLQTGRQLELMWGTIEFLRFVLVVTILSSIITFCCIFIVYLCTYSTDLLFEYSVYGSGALFAGLVVTMKQAHPEREITFFFVKLRVKQLPMIVFCLSVLMAILFRAPQPFMFWGLVVSWVYLRFFQRQPGNKSVVGDLTPGFSFSSFFPENMQPTMSTIGDIFYNLLRLCRLCPLKGHHTESSSDIESPFASSSSAASSSAASSAADVERRRALALHALDQRLKQMELRSGSGAEKQQANNNKSSSSPTDVDKGTASSSSKDGASTSTVGLKGSSSSSTTTEEAEKKEETS
ncbi:hypothetical protein QOT17_008416 [Balamuthia mandrillaris]